MRLSPQQKNALINALTPFINKEHAELRLYGSRAQDHLKGGDIDLLLLIEESNLVENLNEKKHYLLAALKKELGDQRIDLLIAPKKSIETDTFIKLIYPQSLLIKQF